MGSGIALERYAGGELSPAAAPPELGVPNSPPSHSKDVPTRFNRRNSYVEFAQVRELDDPKDDADEESGDGKDGDTTENKNENADEDEGSKDSEEGKDEG